MCDYDDDFVCDDDDVCVGVGVYEYLHVCGVYVADCSWCIWCIWLAMQHQYTSTHIHLPHASPPPIPPNISPHSPPNPLYHPLQVKNGVAADPSMLGRLEESIFPAFQLVLSEDVQEFHPYVFQIFAQLIELRPPPIPPVYMQLLPGLLSPMFWERAGNVPALVRLVQVGV